MKWTKEKWIDTFGGDTLPNVGDLAVEKYSSLLIRVESIDWSTSNDDVDGPIAHCSHPTARTNAKGEFEIEMASVPLGRLSRTV